MKKNIQYINTECRKMVEEFNRICKKREQEWEEIKNDNIRSSN